MNPQFRYEFFGLNTTFIFQTQNQFIGGNTRVAYFLRANVIIGDMKIEFLQGKKILVSSSEHINTLSRKKICSFCLFKPLRINIYLPA